MKLQVDGTCAPALFVHLRTVIGLLWTGIKAGLEPMVSVFTVRTMGYSAAP
jgi:hypothetical protein